MLGSIWFETITSTVSALPDTVFWDNDWPSDLSPVDGSSNTPLDATVLFAQAQTIPSKHGIDNDSQPHLVAQRKTLVMFRPHDINDKDIIMTVRDADGVTLSGGEAVQMEDPENIPKQEGWLQLGQVQDFPFPSQLDDPFVVMGQSSLDTIVGSEFKNDKMVSLFNTQKKEVEVVTQDGSWVQDIYLPNGSEVPEGSKFQITCDSTWWVKVHYPKERNSNGLRTREVATNEQLILVMKSDVWFAEDDPKPAYYPRIPSSLDTAYVVSGQENLYTIGDDPESVGLTSLLNDNDKTPSNEIEIKTSNGNWLRDFYLPKGSEVPVGSRIQVTCDSDWSINVYYPNNQNGLWKLRSLSKGDVTVFHLTSYNDTWIASGDLDHNEYVFGHNFYTAVLDRTWLEPGMNLEFISKSSGKRGALDADVGGVTEVMITTLDAGFLTEPRNEFEFREDPLLHTEYFETSMASRLVVVQYETMHFTEIMLPTGKFYNSISDDKGGVYSGDMREHIGKILLSHGIDLANYGVSSSLAQTEAPHKFTCALMAAHNTVGMYQNGRVVHGLSGGNGMVTLLDSTGNEFSHELGHNYGLGHYVGGFDGSVHQAADKINSCWGWDSRYNTFTPNFSPSNSGKDACLDGKCEPPFLGKYQYGMDSMAGGDPFWGNRYTLYTPHVQKLIQDFLESRAVWDPTSSTGFRKFNADNGKMEEFVNDNNGNKIPRLYRVPVTTIVGYYSPDISLQSYIYPALHGAYGFVYNDDDGSTTGTPNGCELVIETDRKTEVYELDTYVDPKGMNKFHVNIATADRPSKAMIYCRNQLLTERALDGPKNDGKPLTYTVNGAPFSDNVEIDCEDKRLRYGRKKKNCKWVGRGSKRQVRKKCRKKSKGIPIHEWCPKTCAKVGLGPCADILI